MPNKVDELTLTIDSVDMRELTGLTFCTLH